jgi:hypothetical protein
MSMLWLRAGILWQCGAAVLLPKFFSLNGDYLERCR